MTVQQIAGRVAALPAPPSPGAPSAPRGPGFAEWLDRAAGPPSLTVSAHAAQRLGERGLALTDGDRARIADALDTLAAKGSRDAVLLGPDAAFVVNVPNRTVVTALAPDEMRDRAVTQIDSALIL
ncbi:flagellar biosynthesis protein [Rubrivirga sp.]|uniref:flagellar biosynthesis protein n=1 Tax=Rubrivirga sp. TaxID=1885344 RepID=UPI003B52FE40